MESPVFAFPWILKMEPHIEKLFLASFSWNFDCLQCGNKYQQRCVKSLATFTNVIPEWHPLNAVHIGPCNRCQDRSQRRKMVLEEVSSVFMLHFVEGLPSNDLQLYSFHFEGSFYQITGVIQYQVLKKHFVTWTLNSDGTWLKCDDLNGPYCERRSEFGVPASEAHIVIWESGAHRAADPPPVPPAPGGAPAGNVGAGNRGGSASGPESDSAAAGIPPLLPSEDAPGPPADSPQGAAREPENDWLSGLEGLADSDVITLNLVEIQVDSEGNPLAGDSGGPAGISRGPGAIPPPPTHQGELTGENPPLGVRTPPRVADVCPSSGGFNPPVAAPPDGDVLSLSPPPARIPAPEGREIQSASPPAGPERDVGAGPAPAGPRTAPREPLSKKRIDLTACSRATALKPPDGPAQSQPPKEPKKAFVGSWVKSLLTRTPSFMPSCASARPKERSGRRNSLQKVTDLHLPVKGASNFGGFVAKGVRRDPQETVKKAPPPPGADPPARVASASLPTGPRQARRDLRPVASRTPPRPGGNANRPSPGARGDPAAAAAESKTHKLRLKLLKKLQAKKNRLASLDRLAEAQQTGGKPPGETPGPVPRRGGGGDESLQDLLEELQLQIDIADHQSAGPAASDPSPGSALEHEEFLAQLLSPGPGTATFPEPPRAGEGDCGYLEMGGGQTPAPTPGVPARGTPNPSGDHSYYSPVKGSQPGGPTGSPAGSCHGRTVNLDSPLKADILEDFFTASTLSSLASDPDDLPHFDDYLFENC
ncbi:SUMO-specific isopeptidase USPL1 isoform X2 [Tachyglossus aculeatus]|nr:SUMO-specific isopeptidase USPL1 isoform X2 [Tachyglossus aculeatus]